MRSNERHAQLESLNHVSDVEVPPRHVLAPPMMLGVVREVGGTLVISCACRRASHVQAEA